MIQTNSSTYCSGSTYVAPKSKKYSPLMSRLRGLWLVLTKRNFILIHSIKEMEVEGKPGRQLAVHGRTDYTPDSDFLSMKMAIFMSFPSCRVQDENI